jgi:hypothetical protein
MTQDMYQQREYPLRLSAKDLILVKDTKEALRIEGTITYNNGFETRPVPVCLAYLTYEIKDATGKLMGRGSNPQVPCDEYEIVLPSILDEKRAAIKK